MTGYVIQDHIYMTPIFQELFMYIEKVQNIGNTI